MERLAQAETMIPTAKRTGHGGRLGPARSAVARLAELENRRCAHEKALLSQVVRKGANGHLAC